MNYFIATLAVLVSASFAWAQGPHKHIHKGHHGKPGVHHVHHKHHHHGPREAAYPSGTWVGVCHNHTVDVKSPMVLNLLRKGNHIVGTVLLDSDKLVSAPQLTGFVKGDTITFTTGSRNHPLGQIEWRGHVTGSIIKGVYRVVSSSQEGTFLLKLN